MDFEAAAYSAFSGVFTNKQVCGCLFYLSQILCRKIQSFDYENYYKTSKEFRLRVKMILALGFVPEKQFFIESDK